MRPQTSHTSAPRLPLASLKRLALTTTAITCLMVPLATSATPTTSQNNALVSRTPLTLRGAHAYSVPSPLPLLTVESGPSMRASHGSAGVRRVLPHPPEGKTRRQAPPQSSEDDVLRDAQSTQGFRLSIDGKRVAGDGFTHGAMQRATDKAASEVDIQIKYDGLDVVPQLNVGLYNDENHVAYGATVQFEAFSNYNAFIDRMEIRLFETAQSTNDTPLKIIPVSDQGQAALLADPSLPKDLLYQLRVYDAKGRFDETRPQDLFLSSQKDSASASEPAVGTPVSRIGYGVDNTLSRTIKIKGGAVTVYGKQIPSLHSPFLFDRAVPLGINGNFVSQQILPFGEQTVCVDVLNLAGDGIKFKRDIHIKETEFFYVALGDLTLGQRASIGPADLTAADDEDFDDVVVNGRAAFYLKGKVSGRYLITAALDTGEDRLSQLFNTLDDKDPRQLLRRLDADRFYPVYGDDSYTEEGAPTQGRAFVRVDQGDSHVMWGNFTTQITGTEFAHLDRGLYGAIADYNSQALNSAGERKTEATVFAADPGTLPGRDVFRGTGGSLYFLQRQDISIGSERLRIEVTDKVTGEVIRTENLRPQEDYDIDYIQGRILLSKPLQSTVSDGELVRDGGLSGHEVRLVARYEFAPALTDIDGYTVGGRGTHWLGDKIRFGLTGQSETTDSADQTLLGVDALFRHSDESYMKAEFAQSEGPGFGLNTSTDGGFIFDTVNAAGTVGQTAQAYRVEGALDGADLSETLGRFGVKLRGAYGHKGAGFSGTGQIDRGDVDILTAGLEAKLSQNTDVSVQFGDVSSSVRGDTTAVYADITQQFSDRLSGGVGVRYDRRDETAVAPDTLSENRVDISGARTDVSAQLEYDSGNDWSLRAFGQSTVDRDDSRQGNTRGGLGGDIALSSRLRVSGEVSGGDGGLGAHAQLNFQRSDTSEFYLGYALSTDRSDTAFASERETRSNQGTLTAGTRTRFNDSLSIYGEEQYAHSARGRELTHSYGIDFAPNAAWSLGASVENGIVTDIFDGDFERTAFTLSAGRSSEGLRFATNLEGRFETGALQGRGRDRTTWLMRNTLAYDAGQNWEMLGRFNFALSESDQDNFLNSDFVEGVVAAAYRPVKNDRLNALLKYTYFEDLSPVQQVTSNNTGALARQKSQIVSADALYALHPKLTVGAKIGYRTGEVALSRNSDSFVKSDAFIGVLRTDLHIVKKWDALVEARVLGSELSESTQYGALVGVYRHVGKNFKVGVGYSFSKFSDDLTNFETDSDGAFLNLVGKF